MPKASAGQSDLPARRRRTAAAMPAPVGRTLDEFLPLRVAEKLLLSHARAGSFALVGETIPKQKLRKNVIRASFIRFLALGGDVAAPVSELVQIRGAFITGRLALTGCSIARIVSFLDCRFDSAFSAQTAQFEGLGFSGCSLPGLHADGARITGALMLRAGFEATGPVLLTGARIVGDIDCSGSVLQGDGKVALSLNKCVLGGDLILNNGFTAHGEVSLAGANIAGSLFCGAGAFENPEGVSIGGWGIKVGGNIALHSGFRSKGEIRLIGAEVGGDINCEQGAFIHPKGRALNCQGMRVRGGLIWRKVAAVEGIVNLTAATVGSLVDDAASWGKVKALFLDGFHYDRFLGATTPTNAGMRVEWLLKQNFETQGVRFWPSPWEQLTKILRDMGHLEDARLVAIAKQRQMRRVGVIGNRESRQGGPGIAKTADRARVIIANGFSRMLHRIYGWLAGYGYRPLRIVGWMAILWLVSGLAYAAGEEEGLFGPTNPRIYADRAFDRCGVKAEAKIPWTVCADLPPEHVAFQPFMYSLDVILPLIDLKQEAEWSPIVHSERGNRLPGGLWLRNLMWLEILFGWVGSLLLVSVVGRLIERD